MATQDFTFDPNHIKTCAPLRTPLRLAALAQLAEDDLLRLALRSAPTSASRSMRCSGRAGAAPGAAAADIDRRLSLYCP